MAVSINTSDLARAVAQFKKAQNTRILQATQKITLDVGRRCIEGSPVDTGEFRGNWEIETPSALGQNGRISNATPYGPQLARGGSDQAPNGWIEDACEAAVKLGGTV